MIYFTADYSDRAELSALGATFDFTRWQWRVDDYADYKKFSRWLKGGLIIRGGLYFLVSEFPCPYCKKPAKAVAVATGAYTEGDGKLYGSDCLNILYGFEKLPAAVLKFMSHKFGVRKFYSEVYGYSYYTNGCRRCGKPFVDWYLFDEQSSPFFITDTAEKLKMYFAPCAHDLCIDGRVKWSFPAALFADAERGELTDEEIYGIFAQ